MTPELEAALYQLLGCARRVPALEDGEAQAVELCELRAAVAGVDAAMGITDARRTERPPAEPVDLCPCGSGVALLECGRAHALAPGLGPAKPGPLGRTPEPFHPPAPPPYPPILLSRRIPPSCVRCLEPLTWVPSTGPDGFGGQWACRGRLEGCARDP